jgi:parallel beta-helix repeat protein
MSTDSSRRDILAQVALGAGVTLTGAALLSSPERARAQGSGSYPPYNILFVANYGAVGNGTTDDTVAIQNALNALGNNGVLQFQSGKTYAINASGVMLSGRTNVRIDFNNCGIIALANAAQQVGSYPTIVKLSNCINCTVQNGTFNGNGYSGAFIGLSACTDSLVTGNVSSNVSGNGQFVSISGLRNVWEYNEALNSTPGFSVRGFWLGGAFAGWNETDTIVRHNKAISNGATGFALGGPGAQIIGNYAANNGTNGGGAGIIGGGPPGSDHVVIGNISTGNAFHGYQTDISGGTFSGLVLSGNRFFGNAYSGIYLNNATNVTITGNVISGNNQNGAGGAEIGVVNTQVLSITGNAIFLPAGATNDAIAIAGTSSVVTDVVISGNVINNGSQTTNCILLYPQGPSSSLQRGTIVGNSLNGGAVGIYVRANDPAGVLGSVNISGNTIANTATNALFVLGAAAGQITDLRLIGNTGLPFSIDTNTTPAANYANTWNQAYQAGNTFGAAVPDCSRGLVQEWTLNSNCTFFTPTHPPLPGNTLTLVVTQTATGGSGVAWNAAYRNPPVWATGAPNSRATAMFVYDGALWQFIGGSPTFA